MALATNTNRFVTSSRRWLQFSLRTALGGITVVAMALGLFKVTLFPALRQQNTVRSLETAGMTVTYVAPDYESKFVSAMRPYMPRDCFDCVTAVDGWDCKTIDPVLSDLRSLRSLKNVSLYVHRDSNVDLALLGDLNQIESLTISGSRMDVAYSKLHKLTNLRELSTRCCSLSDVGLAELETLSGLERLTVSGTRVTDAGLVHLVRLPRLSYLNLKYDRITDAGAVSLKQLTNLTELDISRTQISNAGLAELVQALPRCKIAAKYRDTP